MASRCGVFEVVDRGRNNWGGLASWVVPIFENHLIAYDANGTILARSIVFEMRSDITNDQQKVTQASWMNRQRVVDAFVSHLKQKGWDVGSWKACEWLDVYLTPAEHGRYTSTDWNFYDTAILEFSGCHIELLAQLDEPYRILRWAIEGFARHKDMVFRWQKLLNDEGKHVGYTVDGDYPWPVVRPEIRAAFRQEDWEFEIELDDSIVLRKPKKRELPGDLRPPFKWPQSGS